MAKPKVVKLSAGTYKPTKSELDAIRKGEHEIARGNFATLGEILNDLDRHRLKAGANRNDRGN